MPFSHDNAFIPYERFHLVVMPLFLVKYYVIPFNPNGPKSKALEKVPNFQPTFVFLTNAMLEDANFLVVFMEWLVACATKLKRGYVMSKSKPRPT